LKEKLQVKSVSKLYTSLAIAAEEARTMRWGTMTPDELIKEKTAIEKSNLFGKLKYLEMLKSEYKV
jgi:hypothetical protein